MSGSGLAPALSVNMLRSTATSLPLSVHSPHLTFVSITYIPISLDPCPSRTVVFIFSLASTGSLRRSHCRWFRRHCSLSTHTVTVWHSLYRYHRSRRIVRVTPMESHAAEEHDESLTLHSHPMTIDFKINPSGQQNMCLYDMMQ